MEGLPELTGSSVYPPDGHYLRHLGLTEEFDAAGQFIARMPARPDLLGADGLVRMGPLAAMADVVAAVPANIDALPDWSATLDLVMHRGRGPVGEIVARPHTIRAGATVLVEGVPFDDGGWATVSFSRLVRREGVNPVARPKLLEQAPPRLESYPSLDEFLQMEHVDGGVQMPLIEPAHNSIGAINGGVIATLMDEAALVAAGSHAVVDDMALHYISGGRVGPFRAVASPIRDGVWRVEARDLGKDSRLFALSTVTTRS